MEKYGCVDFEFILGLKYKDSRFIVTFCMDIGILKTSVDCEQCGSNCALEERTDISDGFEWKCSKGNQEKTHYYRKSIRSGSWFENSSLDIPAILVVTYCWVGKISEEFILLEWGFPINTVTHWFTFCRKLCFLINGDVQIGGEGKTVEIGEWNYNKQKGIEGKWIFGGVERGSEKCFFIIMENWGKEILLTVIKKHILPGTTIISDWKSFLSLEDEGFKHVRVNNNVVLKNKQSNAHINSIQGTWSAIKRHCDSQGPYSCRVPFHLYLGEYIWRRRFQDNKKNLFRIFIMGIASVFNGHQYRHDRPYLCEICQVNLSSKEALDQHKVEKHFDVNPKGYGYQCTYCAKAFAKQAGLTEHLKTHGIDAKDFWCTQCNPRRKYKTRQGLQIHLRTHTGERPFPCTTCSKTFKDGGTLRKHMFLHTGLKPWICFYCKKSFAEKQVLKDHLKWVHFVNQKTSKSFNCPFCSSVYKNLEEILSHIMWHIQQEIDVDKGGRSQGRKRKYVKQYKKHVQVKHMKKGERKNSSVRKSSRARKPSMKLIENTEWNWDDESSGHSEMLTEVPREIVDGNNEVNSNDESEKEVIIPDRVKRNYKSSVKTEDVETPDTSIRRSSRERRQSAKMKEQDEINWEEEYNRQIIKTEISESIECNIEVISPDTEMCAENKSKSQAKPKPKGFRGFKLVDQNMLLNTNCVGNNDVGENVEFVNVKQEDDGRTSGSFHLAEVDSKIWQSELPTINDLSETFCQMCGKVFENRSALVSHVKIHI